jgi:hypothetical protein
VQAGFICTNTVSEPSICRSHYSRGLSLSLQWYCPLRHNPRDCMRRSFCRCEHDAGAR